MDNIKFYEVSAAYVDYLAPHAPHLFRNKKDGHWLNHSFVPLVSTSLSDWLFAFLTS